MHLRSWRTAQAVQRNSCSTTHPRELPGGAGLTHKPPLLPLGSDKKSPCSGHRHRQEQRDPRLQPPGPGALPKARDSDSAQLSGPGRLTCGSTRPCSRSCGKRLGEEGISADYQRTSSPGSIHGSWKHRDLKPKLEAILSCLGKAPKMTDWDAVTLLNE